jgi:ABC-type oligopeptide transport system ATPase subunit
MAKIGSPIDDRIFGNVLEALGEATERRTTIFLDLIEHPATKAKFRSWPFLVSIARTARAADEREQEVGSEEAPPSRWPAHETKAERSEREHRELEERRKTWPTG